MARLPTRLLVTAALAFVVVGCGSREGRVAVEPGTAAIEWAPCGTVQCAPFHVPLDRAATSFGSGKTIELRAYRQLSSAEGSRHLPLIIHPGGPGADVRAAVEGARTLLAPIIDDFDVYALSTRGAIDGTAFDCGNSLADLRIIDIDRAAAERFASDCKERSGELIGRIGTRDSVDDLEQFRRTLGFDKIRFLGWSYGATLGATWAMTYPKSIRAMVLDAPVDPREKSSTLMKQRADRARSLYAALLHDAAEAEPKLPSLTPREVGLAREYVLYEGGLDLLKTAIAQGGKKFAELVDLRLGVTPQGVNDGGIETQIGVHCSDESHNDALETVRLTEPEPWIGFGATFDRICAQLGGSRRPLLDLTVDSSADDVEVMVVSTSGDHVVTTEQSVSLAQSMRWKSVVIDGRRHLSVGFDAVATKKTMAFLAVGD